MPKESKPGESINVNLRQLTTIILTNAIYLGKSTDKYTNTTQLQ